MNTPLLSFISSVLFHIHFRDFAFGAALGAAIVVFVFFGLLIAVFSIICQWKVYEKAGKPGWAVLVPIYNIIILLEIIGKPWWWIFLLLIPIANIVIVVMMMNLLAKSFGQGAGFTVGLIFLGVIFYAILAFSKDMKYVGPAGLAPQQPVQ